MQKEVFIGEHLDSYRRDPKIVGALGGRILLNHDEFSQWYSPPKIRMSARNLPKKINRQPSIEKVETVSNAILELMAEKVCEKKIGLSYGKEAIRRLIHSQFDVLVLVEENYLQVKAKESDTYTKTAANKKLKAILGFIIVEKGECKRLPNAYTVNLICVRSIRDKPRGAILLGAYLHCCKKIGQRYGLLELAGGYKNSSGFFSYSKMGFVKNTTLFDRKCFKDYNNLPMSIDLADYRYTDFVDYASGHRKFTDFRDDTGFLDIVPEKGNHQQEDMQKEIARYCNLIYQIPYIQDGEFTLYSSEDQQILLDIYEEYEDPTLDECLDYLYSSLEELIRFFNESKHPRRSEYYFEREPEPQYRAPSKSLKQKLEKYKTPRSHAKTQKSTSSRTRGPENLYVV